MKLSRLYEDFDKAMVVARSLKNTIDAQFRRQPELDDTQRAFLVATVINKAMGRVPGRASALLATPEEYGTLFSVLAHAYDLKPDDLEHMVEIMDRDQTREEVQAVRTARAYGPEDWLYHYARHQGIPISGQPVEPGTVPAPTPTPTPAPASALPLPDEVNQKLASIGVNTINDLAKITNTQLRNALKDHPNRFSVLHKIDRLLRQHGIKLAESHNYRRQLAETMYGFRVNYGPKPFDQFLRAIDELYLEFDLTDPKVQALAKRAFGKVPAPEEFVTLIGGSSQTPELQERLVKMLAGGTVHGKPVSGKQGGRIIMKRGTVIDADHIVPMLTIQLGVAPMGHYFLAGIGPGTQKVRYTKCKPMSHSEFQTFRMVPAVQAKVSRDPHSTAYEVTSLFKKIMTINSKNIASINWYSGKVDTF
jgi:hypothetical protein